MPNNMTTLLGPAQLIIIFTLRKTRITNRNLVAIKEIDL